MILHFKDVELSKELHLIAKATHQSQYISFTLALFSILLGFLAFVVSQRSKQSHQSLEDKSDTLQALYNTTTINNLSYQDQIKE